MKNMLTNILLFLVVVSCNNYSSKDSNTESEKRVTVVDEVKLSTFKAVEFLKLPVDEFFRKGSIVDLEYGETTLKYLIPTAIFADSNYIYIPNKSRSVISLYSYNGDHVKNYEFEIDDMSFYQFFFTESGSGYALDINNGLYVWDSNQKVIHRDEKTIGISFDVQNENLFIENMINDEKLILDIKKNIEKPFISSYSSFSVTNGELTGVNQKDENSLSVELRKGIDMEISSHIEWKATCEMCMILPKVLSERYILSSRLDPFIDQVSVIGQEFNTHAIEYPTQIDTQISDESAGYTYTGYFYFFEPVTETIYSICTDKNYIRVFRISSN